MSIEIIKMSSKGQIVIPQDIREEIGVGEGTIFAIVTNEDAIILKKIDIPSKEKLIEDLSTIAKSGKIKLKKLGITEKQIPKIVEAHRK